ncbi:MAG: 4-(cytidine 5'-diphospho)-2-C-methyl-D-erythritol kinase [Angelakisella sp.]
MIFVAKAHAKLNLTMEVLGKRTDGYHDIVSLMEFISLADKLELEEAETFSFWCNDKALCGEENLAVRAYRLLEQRYAVAPLAIRLYKRIPCQSGMGGGSADAAAVLHATCALSGITLTQPQLCELGRTLGADVPACILGGRLLAEGIGQRLTPLQQTEALHFVVLMPKVAFSTPEMYRRMDEGGQFAAPIDRQQILDTASAGNPAAIAALLRNSFEAVATPAQAIETAKRRLLESGALGAAMTGAGSAVFGIYKDSAAADSAYAQLLESKPKRDGSKLYRCRSMVKKPGKERNKCLD